MDIIYKKVSLFSPADNTILNSSTSQDAFRLTFTTLSDEIITSTPINWTMLLVTLLATPYIKPLTKAIQMHNESTAKIYSVSAKTRLFIFKKLDTQMNTSITAKNTKSSKLIPTNIILISVYKTLSYSTKPKNYDGVWRKMMSHPKTFLNSQKEPTPTGLSLQSIVFRIVTLFIPY